jgi:diacylglycerol kinase family enzyme
VRTALDGRVRRIDLGRATFRSWAGGDGQAFFANVGSAGISGAIARRANETSKALGGKLSYYWATLAVYFRWQTDTMRVAVDDVVRESRMIDVVVANGRSIAGGMLLCPEAMPDDGLFDVLLIGDVTTRDLLFVLPKTYRGRHLPHPRLELMRGRTVTIETAEPLPLELDGEQPGTTPVRFEIVPRALSVRVR